MMNILDCTGIEQIGEQRAPDGSLYVPHLLFKGERTLVACAEIHCRWNKKGDLRSGKVGEFCCRFLMAIAPAFYGQ